MTGPATGAELELAFPPKPEYVRTVRQAIAALARLHGAEDDVVEDIKLAVSEACNTAIAANAGGAAESVEVRVDGEAGRLVIEVLDPSASVTQAVSGDPSELSTEDLPFDRALALPIIRGLVDEVAITPREDGGASVRMTVSLAGTQSNGGSGALEAIEGE